MVRFIKLNHYSVVPTRATAQSAGYDMHALESGIVLAGERKLIKTGIGWDCENSLNVVGIIKARSSLAHKHGIHVMAGVIDADYPSDQDIGAILYNSSDKDFHYEAGSAIAQMIITVFLTVTDDAAMKGRVGGFGSSGK